MNIVQKAQPGLIFRCLITLAAGLSGLAITARGAESAEKVKLIYGPFNGKISVESLEKFAKTGEMTRELRMYSKFVDRKALEDLGYWLNSRFEADRVTVYKFAHTPEGEQFFQDLGTVIKTHPQRNGYLAIRSALIETADVPSESDGWTIIEAMRNFPTEDLQINTGELSQLQKFWSDNPESNQAALEIFKIRDEKSSAFNPN